MKEFDNANRRRRYGHRIGDLVDTGFNNLGEGVVTGYGAADNNRILVKTDSRSEYPCVAEWCKTIIKVEDNPCERCQGIKENPRSKYCHNCNRLESI